MKILLAAAISAALFFGLVLPATGVEQQQTIVLRPMKTDPCYKQFTRADFARLAKHAYKGTKVSNKHRRMLYIMRACSFTKKASRWMADYQLARWIELKDRRLIARMGNRGLGLMYMLQAGYDRGQWPCLERLWTRESGWRTNAHNPSGAHGIPQALPGSKMGPGWESDPHVQIKWGLRYIRGRYGSPCGAWGAFQSKGWY